MTGGRQAVKAVKGGGLDVACFVWYFKAAKKRNEPKESFYLPFCRIFYDFPDSYDTRPPQRVTKLFRCRTEYSSANFFRFWVVTGSGKNVYL